LIGLSQEDATKIERLNIRGPAGNLEALLEWNPEWSPRLLSLVCHPHPLYGGTMHNKVAFRAAKAAVNSGIPALRFNFRGVGQSQGKFADEVGEREDARAALRYLVSRFPNIPVAMMGFSFGSVVALAVGTEQPEVNSLVGIGVPAASADLGFLRQTRKPKLIVQGTLDTFGPRPKVEALFASLEEPKSLRFVEGVDHFFTGKLVELEKVIEEFLGGILEGL
jgi:alpha/beta superfamily hydrolase